MEEELEVGESTMLPCSLEGERRGAGLPLNSLEGEKWVGEKWGAEWLLRRMEEGTNVGLWDCRWLLNCGFGPTPGVGPSSGEPPACLFSRPSGSQGWVGVLDGV